MSSFQINTLKNGEWVHQPVKVEPFSGYKPARHQFPADGRHPKLGMLSRTVISTPVIRTIVPARIRSPAHNDIVLIGDRFIRVCELRKDDQLYEIARKTDFEPRIVQCHVIGYNYEPETMATHDTGDSELPICAILDENAADRGDLPLQILVLLLETHEYVFIFMGSRDGKPEFVCSHSAGPRNEMMQDSGLHFSIDPESRYMATAFSKSGFCVFELEPYTTLRQQYRAGQPLNPIRSWKSKMTNGYVLKMDFLHARDEDPESVILVLVLHVDGSTRIITYEWRNGNNLHEVLRSRRKGYLVLPSKEMPMHIVPLTVKSSFCLITETSLAVCDDILLGNPSFQSIEHDYKEPTPWYHGTDRPLWASWARPYRRKSYYKRQDNIYIAREDGIVIWLEFRPGEVMATSLEMGDTHLSTSIDTAFTTVSNGFNDVLVIGGDCGNGSIWKPANKKCHFSKGASTPGLELDCTWNQKLGSKGNPMVPWFNTETDQLDIRVPDRLFTTSGRGINGGITEHRVGIPANIGIEFDYTAVREAWVLPQPFKVSSTSSQASTPLLMLLSQHDSSDVLLFSLDPDGQIEVQQLDSEDTFLDMTYQTLDASYDQHTNLCQITEKSIALYTTDDSRVVSLDEILGSKDLKAEHASIGFGLIGVATHFDAAYKLFLLEIDGTNAILRGGASVPAEITCLCVCQIENSRFILAGLQRDGLTTSLAIYNADSFGPDTTPVSEFSIVSTASSSDGVSSSPHYIEAFSSIKKLCETETSVVIIGGTRAGYIAIMSLSRGTLECNFLSVRRLGLLPVCLSQTPNDDTGNSIIASSGTSLISLNDYREDHSGRGEFKDASYIFPGDSNDSMRTLPAVHCLSVLPKGVPVQNSSSISVLMVTSKGVHIAELEKKARPVPRLIPIPGSPKRVLFSHTLDCLVVSTFEKNRPTLLFIDANTGEDLSIPTSRTGVVWPSISGLGEDGDRILCVKEWLYTKDNNQFLFFLVCLKSKKMLIVSTSPVQDSTKIGNRALKYWTAHKIRGDEDPVYCAHASGQNLYYSSGNNLNWAYLDNEDKKFKNKATLRLNSPVISIEDYGKDIIIMTAMQSILVLSPKEGENGAGFFQILNTDPKPLMGNCKMAIGSDDSPTSPFPLMLLGDREQKVSCRWVPKSAGAEIENMFEGMMNGSIRKFCRARSQPNWWFKQTGPRFGRIPSTLDDAEVFGVALDGTVDHFSLLDMDGWRFLSLVETMAMHTPEICPFSYGNCRRIKQLSASELMPLADRKALERCFFTAASRELLPLLLENLDEGRWVSHIQSEQDPAKREGLCFELAYTILEYYLRPVI
ncbi:thermotolerance protein [Ceratocystis lukuohia]|uniref:Thermotolerance protein n=1 Tax=Ceratocystis lukuohia TaxID=2019550 RepID=A0ABR4MFS4_9PEZI